MGKQIQHQEILIMFILAAIATAVIPLQRYITLSRYQHWGLALFVLGLGHFLQLIWSWKHLKIWTRLALTWTGGFMATAGLVFYSNPWLDTRVAIASEAADEARPILAGIFAALAIPLVIFWVKSLQEVKERSETDQPDKMS